jgi:hypothetical protein
MTNRTKTTTIVSAVLVISIIIVISTNSPIVTTGSELKESRFGRLPRDVDRLRVTSVYPDDPNAQDVYFEYTSPSLYGELDALLDFRTVNSSVFNEAHACLGDAMIYFYRGNEICQLRWNYAHGDFFHPGLLTSKSKKNLVKWFNSKGFANFAEWDALERKLESQHRGR